MKKLFLLSTVLLGVIPASQAGLGVHFGIDLPLPFPPPFIIGHAPRVVVAPPVCAVPAPVVCAPIAPPVYCPPAYCPPVVVMRPQHYRYYYPHQHGYVARGGWEHSRGYRH